MKRRCKMPKTKNNVPYSVTRSARYEDLLKEVNELKYEVKQQERYIEELQDNCQYWQKQYFDLMEGKHYGY